MNFTDLQACVQRAIDSFLYRDSDLLRLNVSEWALAHRLAVYLEHQIPNWDVDCEYNRQGTESGVKRRSSGRRNRPDISIHHRGHLSRKDNLLVIEIKKRGETADSQKAKEYTSAPSRRRRYQYQYGLALSFEGIEMRWYENGVERN